MSSTALQKSDDEPIRWFLEKPFTFCNAAWCPLAYLLWKEAQSRIAKIYYGIKTGETLLELQALEGRNTDRFWAIVKTHLGLDREQAQKFMAMATEDAI